MYYKSLFNINIHHGYFLDQGERKFLPIFPEDEADKLETDEKESALSEYDVSKFLTIQPTSSTKRIAKNYKIITRLHSQGLRVLVNTEENETEFQPIIPLEDDVTLTFEIQATDTYFNNYTALNSLSDNKLYLFTNVEPSDQEADFENIFENNGGPIDDRFLLKEEASRDLIKNIAAEDEPFTSVTGQFSITHTIQLIEEDDTLTNNEKETQIANLINTIIQRKKKNRVVGYLRLTIKGDGGNDLLEFDGDEQKIKETTPEFTISFINRKTFWRFISTSDGVTLTTENEKWLSKNGFVEIIGQSTDDDDSDFDPEPIKEYKFPNPTVNSIKKENNNYYSEIFI